MRLSIAIAFPLDALSVGIFKCDFPVRCCVCEIRVSPSEGDGMDGDIEPEYFIVEFLV